MSVPSPSTPGPTIGLLALLAISCAAPEPPSASAERETLRVVDINVWSGLDYRGTFRMGTYETPERREARYRALVSQLRVLAPDVIGVHEANPIPRYVDRLATDLGYDAVRYMGLGGIRAGPVGLPWNLREGDAILARPDLDLRFEARRRLSGGAVGSFFSFNFSDAIQALAASIGVNGRRIHLVATHLHSGEAAADSVRRLAEAESILAFLEDLGGGTVVLMGDFNTTPSSPAVRRLLAAGFIDAHGVARGDAAGPTWDPRRNLNIREFYLEAEEEEGGWAPRAEALVAKRIDLVLVRPALPITDAGVVLDRVVDGVHASDHFGVLAELRPAAPDSVAPPR